MARATKAERKRRREAALVKISEGYGFADTVTFVMSEWGCSRSTARRDCHWAHGELQLGLDAHDVQHLVTHLCTSLQRISLKAEMVQTGSGAPRNARGTDQIKRSAVGLVNEGASLLI